MAHSGLGATPLYGHSSTGVILSALSKLYYTIRKDRDHTSVSLHPKAKLSIWQTVDANHFLNKQISEWAEM